jgi:hypothetical protein
LNCYNTFFDRLRTGDWVNRKRLHGYPIIFLFVLAVTGLIAAGFYHDGLDASGRPLGTDFISFWSASRLLLQGHPEAAYDHGSLFAMEQSIGGRDTPLYTWLYPPVALLFVAPLATLPYLSALYVWIGITLVGYLTALWRLLPDRRALVPMLAFAPVWINAGHGQNGFLSGALMGWGLLLLRGHPWFAGLLMGALCYKPQLALLIPVALASARLWQALATAAITAFGLVLLSYGILGSEVWTAFIAKSDYARQMLEEGLVPWQKMTSAFAAIRSVGGSIALAWVIQGFTGLIAAWAVWQVWRRHTPRRVKAAVLATGTLLAAPLSLDYDATLFGIAIAALTAEGLRRGFLDWEKSALAVAWALPLFWRPVAMATDLSLAPAVLLLLLWLAVRRAYQFEPDTVA